MWNIATILSPHKILLLLFIILVLHEIVCHTLHRGRGNVFCYHSSSSICTVEASTQNIILKVK